MLRDIQDTDLVKQVLAGDQQAYAALVTRYQGYVFTLVCRFIQNREDAEEVAQDVFIKAYRSLAGFRGDSKFSTWLYTIVNSTCLSFLRKKQPVITALETEQLAQRPDLTTEPVAMKEEQQSKTRLLRQAIAQLSEDDAAVITLFYQAEQSIDEMAIVLGITSNNAKVKLHRARTKLKEKMEIMFKHQLNDLYHQ